MIVEWLGEDNQEKIMDFRDCTGSIDEVFFKIRSRLDPFFVRPDDTTDDIKTSADFEEEEIKRMPRCDFGDYCPVTYVDDGYLVKGGADEEGASEGGGVGGGGVREVGWGYGGKHGSVAIDHPTPALSDPPGPPS